ncbi:MAG: hypothetical protein JWM88_2183, partial [Verrucomicrobia bacterium]|nr:hypothetical protein [Verrucomicrobiota bacterium]
MQSAVGPEGLTEISRWRQPPGDVHPGVRPGGGGGTLRLKKNVRVFETFRRTLR